MSIKLWTLEYADAQFSHFIIKRDKRCQYPYCNQVSGLGTSHFHLRSHKATRFDPDNCVALCWKHHQEWEIPVPTKNPAYRDFMLKRLGAERFTELAKRANSIMKVGDAILALMARLSQNKL